MIHVIYLHGFASSAQSSKAAFFRSRLMPLGVRVVTPDFNEPDFSTLTVTRMLEQVRQAIDGVPPGPVALIGSSLGGFVAVHAAARFPERIERLVLLAPALDFDGNRLRDLGDRGVDDWRRTDRLEVFHYGYGRMMPVHFALFEDASQYDAFAVRLDLPIQAFQGLRDTAVDPETVRRWSVSRPNVELHLLDDDHQLHASLERIWTDSARFLGVSP